MSVAPLPAVERVMWRTKVDPATGCWVFQGKPDHTGYGRVRLGPSVASRTTVAHRVTYEDRYGPVPAGLVLDHLCRNKICVRPDHLEAVTNGENVMRGLSFSAQNARRLRCKNGHTLGAIFQSREGRRDCRECHRERGRLAMRAWRARRV